MSPPPFGITHHLLPSSPLVLDSAVVFRFLSSDWCASRLDGHTTLREACISGCQLRLLPVMQDELNSVGAYEGPHLHHPVHRHVDIFHVHDTSRAKVSSSIPHRHVRGARVTTGQEPASSHLFVLYPRHWVQPWHSIVCVDITSQDGSTRWWQHSQPHHSSVVLASILCLDACW